MTVDPHNLSGAYALDALNDVERAAYERHLAECPDCADEVHGFLATAARLGSSAEELAPPHLRDRVMEAVARTPQERPAVSPVTGPGRFRRTATRLTLAAAALAVIVSVGWSVSEHNRNAELEARQAGIAKVLSAPDAQMATDKVGGGGSVRLVRSDDMDRAVLVASDLPRLDGDHVYQMWTLTGGTPASAGLMSGDGSTVSTHLMKGIAGVSAVAVTVEPAGGSDQPTTKPIATVSTT
ncbi:MAG: anti-sigma factor [Nocardioidaceae bacterium]